MKLKNIVLSLVFTLLLYFIWIERSAIDTPAFYAVFFGLLVAGAYYAYREWLSNEEVKSDERTQLIAGKAARVTLVASVILIIIILASLALTGWSPRANGVLAVLLGAISLVYSVAYAYLDKT